MTIFAKQKNQNILQIIQEVQETISKKQLVESSTNLLLSISGGQDSIFLLFCLSFLQTQLHFTFKAFWCNHFWQIDSFYTTLHLTKYTVNLSSSLIGFIPLHSILNSQIHTNKALTTSLPLLSTQILDLQISDLNAHTNRRFVKVQNKSTHKHKSPFVARTCKPLFCPFFAHTNLRFVKGQPATGKNKSEHKSEHKHKSEICVEICACACVASTNRRFVCRFARACVASTNRRFVCRFARACVKICDCEGFAHTSTNQRFVCRFVKVQSKRRVRFVRGSFSLEKFTYSQSQIRDLCENDTFCFSKTKRGELSKDLCGLFSESISRNWRHITAERSYTFYCLDKIIYGHTLSDRIETIIFNLVRGSGNKGVTPLPWKRKLSKFSYNKFYLSLERILKNTHYIK